MKKKLLFLFTICAFIGFAQQGNKPHYTFIAPEGTSTLFYEKALQHTSLDELRYLNERRIIPIEGTSISLQLYSAKELHDLYGKPISPIVAQLSNDVKLKLSDGHKLGLDIIGENKKQGTDQSYTQKETITQFGGNIKQDYSSNESWIQTIHSDNGESPYLNFKSFALESHFDVLYIFDGNSTSAKLIGEYTGGIRPTVIKASGTDLTLVYTSDSYKKQEGFTAEVGRGPAPPPPSTMNDALCSGADPFCTGTTYNYTNNTGVASGGSMNCLGSTPNPTYYYLQIANSGNISISISQHSTTGALIDVDYDCWGPFTSVAAGCPVIPSDEVDCSYSASATETCVINGAVTGQFYILLLTNYSNEAGSITFSQTGGTGSTNCSIVSPCTVNATNTGPYCVGQTISLAATTTATPTSWHWTGPSAYTAATQNSTRPGATAVMGGTYTVTLVAGTSTCTATTAVTVNASPTITVNSPSKCGATGATLTASGANTYSWSPSTGLSGTTGASVIASPTATTVYTVTGTSASGCTATATSTVTVVSNPTITVTNTVICSLTKVTLIATGATTYTWSANEGGETVSTVTVQPATTTQYTVTGSVGTCTALAVATVSVVPNPTVAVTSTAICSGGTGVIIASGATTYTWNTGPTGANLSASPTTTTQYTVTGTTGSCTAAAVGTISVTPTPTVTVNSPSICSGTNATLTGTGATTYSWSTGQNNINPITVSPTITTSYTVTGANGTCTNSAVSTVSVTPAPTVVVNSSTICAGQQTATLTASGATTYTWIPGGTTANPLTISPGSTTSYTVTGANGTCTNSAVAIVTVNTLPTLSIITPTICSGNTTTITGGGASTYTWSANAGGVNTSTASVTPPGNTTYTISGTSAAGCTNTAVGTVSVSASVTVAVNNPIICTGSSATLTATGATSYTWNTGPLTPSIVVSPTVTTSYTVSGTQNGCVGLNTSTVTVVANPTVNVSPATICIGNSTTLTVTGSSTYTWTPTTGLSPTTGAVVVANPTTTTVYTINASAGTCTTTGTTTVTVNPLPTVTVNSSTICIGQQTATLTANGASTYTWAPSATLSGSTGTTVTGTPTITTDYTVTGTDVNSCTNTATSTITVNPLPIVTVNTATICMGQQTATLTANGASTYTWTPAVNIAPTVGNPALATPTSTQNYTVTATDIKGCVNTASTTVTVNTLPTITANSGAICLGQGTAVLTANGASTYTWTPGATLTPSVGASVVASPTATQVYTIIGTDANGCTNMATSTVAVGSLPIITVNTVTICVGQQTATLTASGASTYTWGPSVTPTIGNPVTANPAFTQVYNLSGTDANGCINSATATVTVNQLPNISVTSEAICLAQETATLTASGASTYTWTPNLNITPTTGGTVQATPQSTQIYTVTGTDGNGCTNTNTSTVTVNSIPVVTATSTSVCPGDAGTIMAAGANSYTWSTSSPLGATLIQTPTVTTQYTVTGVDLNTCTNTAVGTIMVYNSPTVTVNNATVCAAGQQNATLTASGANTYTWFPAYGLDTYSGNVVHTTPTAVTVVYIITGTSAIGSCTAVATSTLIVNALPTPTVTSNTPCLNQPLTFTCAPPGLSNYAWTGPGSFSGTGTNPSIPVSTANSAGTYTVLVTDNNTPACTNSATVTVVVNPLPVITASTSPVCVNQTILLSATGGVSYSWSGPGTPPFSSTLPNPQIPNATLANAGNYVVTATDANGCVSGNVAIAIVNALPIIAVNTSTICVGQQTATLTAAGASTYVWSTGTNPSTGSVVNADPASNSGYTVTGTDANGCVNTGTTVVTVLSLPTVSTNTIAPDCAPLCTTFSATSNPAASSYSWSLGNGQTSTSANPAPCYSVAGTDVVTATITDINGCVNTATTMVTVLAIPVANFDYGPQPVSILTPNVQFTNLSTPGLPYHHWNFGDGNGYDTSNTYEPSHMYNTPDTFAVTLIVATASGCADTVVKQVIINDDYAMYVPNAFSPNGDNLNEIFLPVGDGIKDYKLYIFDRWGNMVYYTDDITKGWDGRYLAKGTNIVQQDVYVWKIDLINVLNSSKHLSGTVTLLK